MPKDKITDKQFLLVINGPSGGGKSAVADALSEKYGNIFKAKSDVIKWLISDYVPAIHRAIVHNITLELIRVALSQNLSVIKEGGSYEPEKYREIARAANIPLFVANVEAPWEVLMRRFEERLEAKKRGARIANTDPHRFKELYDMYNNTKPKTDLNFDSSKQSIEEIAEAIAAHIKNYQ